MEKIYLKILEKAYHSKVLACFLLPLTVLSFFFWIGTVVRKRFLKQKETKIPIITIGNISFGGTGKTPFLLFLLKHVSGPVAYVSRGYRRKEREVFVGKWPLCTYEACGDEAMIVASRFKDIVLSIADDKWKAVQNVPESRKIIFLDDGLQRYDIPKVLEIATVDVQNPNGYGGLFPRGLLREPMSRLKEVDYIVLTNVPLNKNPEIYYQEYSKKFQRPVIVVETVLSRFFSQDGSTKTISPGSPVALFSSIASPKRVKEFMERRGFVVVDHLIYPDHVDVEEEKLYTYCESVRAAFPDAVLVGTEKDFVKKKKWMDLKLPLLFSEIDLRVVAGKDKFEELVCERIKNILS